MSKYISTYQLQIDSDLLDFINYSVLPDLNIDQDFFWKKLKKYLYEFTFKEEPWY